MKKDDYFDKRFKGKYGDQKNNPTNVKKLNEINSLVFVSGKLLDIGCAYGFFLHKADSFGYKTYGIDISRKALLEAKKNTNAILIRADITKNIKNLKGADICVALNTLEHVENYVRAIKNVRKILKKNGLFFIYVPTGRRWLSDYSHINYFTVESLKFVLEKNGFKVISIGEEGGFFQKPFGLFRLITKGNTNFNYVFKGTGSFITCYSVKA